MWLAILFVGLLFFIGHAVYFSARMKRALALVFPRSRPWLRPLRVLYLVVACSLPVLLFGYAIYALLVKPDTIGPPDSRLYDYLIELPFWLVALISLQISLLVIPLDLIHLLLARCGLLSDQRWTWRRNSLVLLIAAGTAVVVPLRTASEARGLTIRIHDYRSPDLPADLDDFEIALIADMQADQYTGPARLSQLVDATNQAHPDLILIAGDMITRPARYIEVAAEAAARLRAPHGVFACIGDHDNFAYRDRVRSLREVIQALARRGVPMLDNDVRHIQIGRARLAIILATNNYVSRIDAPTTRALLDKAAPADLRILVAHQPSASLLADAQAGGVDLFLSGHTHGGQVNFWLPALDLTPARVENRYISGGFWLGDMLLVVSNGLGMSVAPFRYRAPATLDLIRLHRGPR